MVDCFYWRAAYSYGKAAFNSKHLVPFALDFVCMNAPWDGVLLFRCVVVLSLSVNNSNRTNRSVEGYIICVLLSSFRRVLSFCYEVTLMYDTAMECLHVRIMNFVMESNKTPSMYYRYSKTLKLFQCIANCITLPPKIISRP